MLDFGLENSARDSAAKKQICLVQGEKKKAQGQLLTAVQGSTLVQKLLTYAQVSPIHCWIGHNKDWQLIYLY